jgi:hypothetical protein
MISLAVEHALPLIRFMAMEMVSWVSLEMAPRDMPPVQKRFMMFSAGSTSSRSISEPKSISQHCHRRIVLVVLICLIGFLHRHGQQVLSLSDLFCNLTRLGVETRQGGHLLRLQKLKW